MEWVTTETTKHSDSFPHLASDYLHPLLNFLWRDENGKYWAKLLRQGEKASAPQFFHDWMGWNLRRDPKKLANTIAAMGRVPH